MTFQEALKNVKIYAVKEDPSVDVIIRFGTEFGEGNASLTTKNFFKNQAGTMMTVKRAWEYACKEYPERENAVTQIEIRSSVDIAKKALKTA